MINKSIATVLNGKAVDHICRDLLTIIGVSTGAGTIVHLDDATTPADQTKVENILANYGGLTVNADKTTMTEGDAAPVITVSSADATLGYVVLLDGNKYASGDVVPSAGTATLNLVSPVAGVYQIFVFRKTGDYSNGSVTITVNGV